ncbi:very short patch repair endonuclease [Burkholderia multivorans]|uniref:very short patch repair endonuclease n=1 Tax=Burkholderia multivorans TaxID=87883 RepID=UPI0021BFEDDE|nr:very short patch repair endonuclease [Burkholderia multivorans]
MDTVAPAKRSSIMKAVGRRNTGPELVVRRALFRLGFRFRLHDRKLPGSPDVVFRSRRAVIFVHGCFWHGHDCRRGRAPSTNTEYWHAKLQRNKERDAEVALRLEAMGWRVLTVWECQIRDASKLDSLLLEFLQAPDEM